jgi:predicted membrane-bound mannosyltransferase
VCGLSGESWLWIGIVALATVLRFWGLGDKPLHHDESMHAYFSLSFARDPASYEYDPLLHGPFQFHAEGIVFGVILLFSNLFHVASAAGNAWINDTTARILPATTGVGLVAITYGLRRELGRVAAPVAAFLLAVSPAFVYFSRFLREDIYFACFTYLTVMCAVQFARKRSARWLVATTLAFVLAYATKESIYLNVAVWGAFLVVLVVWEIGHAVSDRLPRVFSDRERAFFGHAGPLLLLGAIVVPSALWGLHRLNTLSAYINTHTAQTDQQVTLLENNTVALLLYASIALALVVIIVLVRQILFDTGLQSPGTASAVDETRYVEISELDGSNARPGRAGGWLANLRARLDPQRQPLLSLLLGTSWVPWFVAFVAGWVLFAALYWVVPGLVEHGVYTIAQGFQVGVGRGIWQGLYYWIQQQQIARGAQPWYYYLILIPLYEQLAVVFGLAGLVRALVHPTRFRLFLVWWFVGTLVLYSWAGEKMPWLSIHILLPLMLLAAIGLEWPIRQAWALVQRLAAGEQQMTRSALVRPAGAVLGLTAAVVLLVPMLHGMLVLSHQDAANGPHEMMVYVQTTPDVQRVMDKINRADALLYGGRHQLKIAVGQGEEWPFYWYLRDYSLDPHPGYYASFDPSLTSPTITQEDVLLLTESDAATFLQAHPTGYRSHTYQLRSWWDEGYKPPITGGVGFGSWLSYGDAPPPHAKFDLGRAVTRLWSWLWGRTPLGYADGSYNFVLVVRDGVPIQP